MRMQHLGPVLAFGAAGAGMHGDDGVERIGLAGEHGARFELFGERGQSLDVALEIGENVFAFAGQLEVGFDVAGAAHQLFVVGDKRFKALAVAHQWLGWPRDRSRAPDRQAWFLFRRVPCGCGQGQRYSRRSRTWSRTGA